VEGISLKQLIQLFLILVITSQAFAGTVRDLDKEYSRTRIKLGGKTLNVYIADTDDRREKGLMFIKTLGADDGMLFVFESAHPIGFWMRNTLIPLSIGFFDERGVLFNIQEMSVPGSIMDQHPPSYESEKPALYALEMNKNWFAKNKIKPGAKLVLKLNPEKSPRP
jgi:uncharacterized membrane protein (UPF0127 family)